MRLFCFDLCRLVAVICAMCLLFFSVLVGLVAPFSRCHDSAHNCGDDLDIIAPAFVACIHVIGEARTLATLAVFGIAYGGEFDYHAERFQIPVVHGRDNFVIVAHGYRFSCARFERCE